MQPKIDMQQLERDYTNAVQAFYASLDWTQTRLLFQVQRLDAIYNEEKEKESINENSPR